MKMTAQIFGWLVFLALIKNFTCTPPFTLEDHPLTAKEGSCIEIKCTVTRDISDKNAYWFWMKDATWNKTRSNFDATIIYSSDNLKRPVSQDFEGRVKYVGSSSSSWSNIYKTQPLCSILICNLKIHDSGQYSFRFVGPDKSLVWVTQKNVTLTVTENPCLISFEKQPVVPVMKENDTITLTCSTLKLCSSSLQIEHLSISNIPVHNNDTHKSISVNFTASWQDDGRVFTCQIQPNTDNYLRRSINVTVEYAPRDVSIRISSENTKEGDSVTLTCDAKGNPNPTFSFLRKNTTVDLNSDTSSQRTIAPITVKDNGEYHCEAKNKYGSITSKPLTINVTYAPDVELKMTSPTAAVKRGDTVALMCNVIRSNPPPTIYYWFKDGTDVGYQNTNIFTKQMNLGDSGSYTCKATNAVDSGTSKPLLIQVQYRPLNTNIVTSQSKETVKVESLLTFTCKTDAYPRPFQYSWYRYYDNEQTDSSLWTSKTTHDEFLHVQSVQRADKACYTCNATNIIGTGQNSAEVCITVLYSPTVPVLSMKTEVTENQTMTISCTVESFPVSTLTLTRTSTSNARPSELSSYNSRYNEIKYTFNVTSGHAGFYSCNAENSEGSNKSLKSELVVKYTPKNVMIVHPDVVENRTLTLYCTAKSYPQVNSFSWTKDGKENSPIWRMQNFTVKSVSLSDNGVYRCAASNEVGTGHSQAAEVKVQYGPKHTKIIKTREQQLPGRRSSITLSCSTQCHPPVTRYLWYKEEKGIKKAQYMHHGQSYTVFSDQPGVYYCVAKNEISEKKSDSVHLFDGTLIKLLKICLCVILPLLIIVIIIFVYRRRRNSARHQGTTPACHGFLGWLSGDRRGPAMHGTFLAEPSRSRDDLLPDRSRRPEARRCQPAPDSTPAADITTVYSMVNLPRRKQAPAAQKPTKLQGGQTVDGPTAHASLHFEDKQTDKQPTEDAVYAKVCKSNAHAKNEQTCLPDYENIGTTVAAQSPNPLDDDDDDTDSSDDDVQLSYTQVSFIANPGHRRAASDSSSSADYEIQYSDVKA